MRVEWIACVSEQANPTNTASFVGRLDEGQAGFAGGLVGE